LLDASIQTIERVANPACPVCGNPGVLVARDLIPANESEIVLTEDELADIGPVQTVVLVDAGENATPIVEGREFLTVPVGDLVCMREIAERGPTLLVCRTGLRSAAFARLLRAEGLRQIYALAGPSPGIRFSDRRLPDSPGS